MQRPEGPAKRHNALEVPAELPWARVADALDTFVRDMQDKHAKLIADIYGSVINPVAADEMLQIVGSAVATLVDYAVDSAAACYGVFSYSNAGKQVRACFLRN